MIQSCPDCRTTVPVARTLWGLGKPFRCKGCGRALVIPRNFTIPAIPIIAFYIVKPMLEGLGQYLVLFLVLALFVQMMSFLFLPARLFVADASDTARKE